MTKETSVITVNADDSVSVLTLKEELTEVIRANLENIGRGYLEVGKALNEVREEFENAKEFLEWVANEFGLQKAQTYKMMKVSKVFGEDDRFKGVSFRVLAVLAGHVEDAAVMERAVSAAEAGKLDSPLLTSILAPAKPAPVPPTNPAPGAGDTTPLNPVNTVHALDGKPDLAGALGKDNPEELTPQPHNVVIDGQTLEASPAPNLPTPAPAALQTTERERALLSQLEILKKVVEQLQEAQKKQATERDSKVKAAPLLPQFKSKCLYARLGLSAEESQDAKQVKKAQRELVKLGYGEGHEAWPAISEAVTALTTK